MAETMADWSREEASCGVRPGKVRWSSSRAKLAAALAKAQRQVKGAVKD